MTITTPHLNGWLILDKPLGLSSAQGVAAAKRILRGAGIRPDRIGHGGTLDPLATGVLPIAIGEATKLAGRMLDATKGYDFTVQWGVATATEDAEGAVTATSDVRPDASAIAAVLPRFTGPIDQVPPTYSALKVDGKRAYALARAGEAVALATRHVTIHSLALLATTADSATFCASVSKGTYIRSLARDLALALGTVGHVTMLRRTKAGPFAIAQAISLDKFEQSVQGASLEQVILPLMAGLDDIPALVIDPDQAAALRQGRKLTGHPAKPGTYLACLGSVPVALVEIDHDQVRVLRGFNM
ncbi:tRNA pseudouridine(55) synthase TruB [Polymorphobacter fuscus]|uniref:tRNA pseudouridine synthase B n=1 Tax=Sandarakinorhabdus fusca TaxID=1439888 RepID=A0A7C9KZJ5_9SPHN|nr:tRNA pseudouridine(55) synthase TruB [Polymorphobacter fuscus]KAB7644816.1 tRNA pseudouridine(55) synthase TruB [Polymorphobacter fuscus]MQT18088.1 tRNA pseudouridine(55) synthase TruB [Polymorphobacter fuscus]NJC09406.1 tRNA pseudouridine55 synthase [Polymorphobacter fuscus]